jgi:hypothetical protein
MDLDTSELLLRIVVELKVNVDTRFKWKSLETS